jgi:hypothetical protein
METVRSSLLRPLKLEFADANSAKVLPSRILRGVERPGPRQTAERKARTLHSQMLSVHH